MFRSQTKKSKLLRNEDVTYLIDQADDKFKHGQFGDAVNHYNAVLKRAPNNFRALHNKGLALFALSKFQKSIECYDRALGIHPNASHVKLNKALSLNSNRNFKEAKSLLDELVRLAPTNKQALNARALSEFNLGLDAEGMQDLKKAIEIDPTYTMAWNNLGCFYLGLGELDSAIECFDQTLAVDTRNYDAFLLKDMAVERRERRVKRP
ncbi:MAG TPA: tetratricopeptide repeat protein [Candidatus Bathyarchaeia archaeon]|nr:tetratricopeptide repeat protein [Candidatus Bathyarchaeia archaeon]